VLHGLDHRREPAGVGVSPDRIDEPALPRGRLRDSDPETLAGIALLAVAGSFGLWRLASRHPLAAAGSAAAVAVLALAGVWVRARVRDRVAARRDPRGAGVVIGSVRGSWWLARRRRFVIPWTAFTQHVLIDGPTGRGKTFTFVLPLLRANVARRDTGVFYLDGKGDRIDQTDGDQPGVGFDFVFCPEDPAASAGWNPLGGPDPVQAAREFAAALFPEATTAGANFYEARAVFAITRVAPAMALTGFGLQRDDEGATWHRDAVLAGLIAAGLDGAQARLLLRQASLEDCGRQLMWLPYRPPGRDIAELVRRKAAPNPRTPLALLNGSGGEVTPAALGRVLFGDGQLERLAEKLGTIRREAERRRRREDMTALLAQLERHCRADQPATEGARRDAGEPAEPARILPGAPFSRVVLGLGLPRRRRLRGPPGRVSAANRPVPRRRAAARSRGARAVQARRARLHPGAQEGRSARRVPQLRVAGLRRVPRPSQVARRQRRDGGAKPHPVRRRARRPRAA